MRPHVASPRPVPTRRVRAPSFVSVVAGLVLLGLAVGPMSVLFESPPFVARITFVNPTEYDLAINATDADRDGWTPVGTARRKSTTVHEEIIDKGEVWIFRFGGQGDVAGELRVTRAELEGTNWMIRIPDRIADELRAKGAPPTP